MLEGAFQAKIKILHSHSKPYEEIKTSVKVTTGKQKSQHYCIFGLHCFCFICDLKGKCIV